MTKTSKEFEEKFTWDVIQRGKTFDLCRRVPTPTTKELIDETAINYCITHRETGVIELLGNQLWATLNNFNTMERYFPLFKAGQTIADIQEERGTRALMEALQSGMMPDVDPDRSMH